MRSFLLNKKLPTTGLSTIYFCGICHIKAINVEPIRLSKQTWREKMVEESGTIRAENKLKTSPLDWQRNIAKTFNPLAKKHISA